MNDMSLNPNLVALLKKNFPSFLVESNGETLFDFNVGNTIKKLKLTSVNTEKICYALSHGQHLKGQEKQHIEHQIGKNFADVCCILPNNGEPIYLGITENKILDGNLEKTLNNALTQVFDNYITTLIQNGAMFAPTKDKPKNFAVTICVFNPEVFLSNPYNFKIYCDDGESNAEQRLEKYGFVIMNAFVNIDSIKNGANNLISQFKEFLNGKIHSTHLSLIAPNLVEFLGYAQKDASDCIDNLSITTKIANLNRIPLFNHNSASKINNPRDISQESNHIFKKDILTTLLNVYKKFCDSINKNNSFEITKEECYRSLGAKAREVIYNSNQTIIILDDTRETSLQDRFKKVTTYYSSDISLIDGQHSTREYFNILKDFEQNNTHTIDLSSQNLIEEIFGNLSAFNYTGFVEFLREHPILLSAKGFSDMSLAQQAAKNQNNIRKQTTIEVITNHNKERSSRICNYMNSFNSNYKVLNPKSSFSHEMLKDSKIKPIKAHLIINVWAFFNEDFIDTFISKQDNYSKIYGNQSSITTPNPLNYHKTLEWFIQKNQDIFKIIKNLEAINDNLIKLNDELSEIEIAGIIDKIMFIKQEIEDFILENKNFSGGKDVIKKIISLTNRIDDTPTTQYLDLIPLVESALNSLDNMQSLNTTKVKNAFDIIAAAQEYADNNRKSFTLLKRGIHNMDTYFLNILCLELRIGLIGQYTDDSNTQLIKPEDAINYVTKELIDKAIKVMDKNLNETEKHIETHNIPKKSLVIGSNQKDLPEDIKKIMFSFYPNLKVIDQYTIQIGGHEIKHSKAPIQTIQNIVVK